MKRLLQVASAGLVVLAGVLGLRIVRAVQVAPPELREPPQIASTEALPPAPQNSSPRGVARDSIVAANLFETERGYREVDNGDDDATVEAPLPPPTNVVLNGVFVSRNEPMAILTDSSSGNKQLTLHVGDNVGDYQVGKISERQVTLIGRGNQEFLLELAIKKGGAALPRSTAAARGARPAAARPGQPRTTPTAAQRAQAARERAAAARERAQAARAQTPAQRAAAARTAARAQADKGSLGRAGGNSIDPTQARLEALKRLREAAAKR